MALILFVSTDKAGITGEHEFDILPEGLQENTKAHRKLTKWYGIKSVRKTKNFILVRINAYPFHIIPRRAFEDQESYDKFWNEILTHHNAATKHQES